MLCAFSRLICRLFFGRSDQICTLAHEAGDPWETAIDALFFLGRGEIYHCARAADWDRCPMAAAYQHDAPAITVRI